MGKIYYIADDNKEEHREPVLVIIQKIQQIFGTQLCVSVNINQMDEIRKEMLRPGADQEQVFFVSSGSNGIKLSHENKVFCPWIRNIWIGDEISDEILNLAKKDNKYFDLLLLPDFILKEFSKDKPKEYRELNKIAGILGSYSIAPNSISKDSLEIHYSNFPLKEELEKKIEGKKCYMIFVGGNESGKEFTIENAYQTGRNAAGIADDGVIITLNSYKTSHEQYNSFIRGITDYIKEKKLESELDLISYDIHKSGDGYYYPFLYMVSCHRNINSIATGDLDTTISDLIEFGEKSPYIIAISSMTEMQWVRAIDSLNTNKIKLINDIGVVCKGTRHNILEEGDKTVSFFIQKLYNEMFSKILHQEEAQDERMFNDVLKREKSSNSFPQDLRIEKLEPSTPSKNKKNEMVPRKLSDSIFFQQIRGATTRSDTPKSPFSRTKNPNYYDTFSTAINPNKVKPADNDLKATEIEKYALCSRNYFASGNIEGEKDQKKVIREVIVGTKQWQTKGNFRGRVTEGNHKTQSQCCSIF
jgi:hypothetical protein